MAAEIKGGEQEPCQAYLRKEAGSEADQRLRVGSGHREEACHRRRVPVPHVVHCRPPRWLRHRAAARRLLDYHRP